MDKIRCFGTGNELYERYHDEEWGRPFLDAADERCMFERLVLEGFLAGLSWLTILRKREEFRTAFDGFVPELVGAYGEPEVEGMLSNPGIIRNRQKIEAAIGNARALVRLHDEGLTLGQLLREHLPEPRPARATDMAEVPTHTPGSIALSKELKRHGFRFVGPITLYSMWQATGMIDDHLADCWLVTEGHLPGRAGADP